MPWLAQHPGGHPHYADPGSQLETIYRRLGYVDVAAPGSDDTDTLDDAPADDTGEAPQLDEA